jgi:hypothetical protein
VKGKNRRKRKGMEGQLFGSISYETKLSQDLIWLSSCMKKTAERESKIWAWETRGREGLELAACPLVDRGCTPCVKKSRED